MTGNVLKDALRRTMVGWHPNLRKLVEMIDPEQIFLNRVRTSQPSRPLEVYSNHVVGRRHPQHDSLSRGWR